MKKETWRERRLWRNKANELARKYLVMFEYSKRVSKYMEPRCNCCGEKMLLFLTIDHKKKRNNVERKKKLGGKDLYTYLIDRNFPPNRQALCFNCNSAKSDIGYCPHELRRRK